MVEWWSGRDDVTPSGYWDQTFVDDLFAGRVWPLRADLDRVLVVNGRMNVNHVDALNHRITDAPPALLVVTSDEESVFPWMRLDPFDGEVWVMTPRPDRHAGCPASRYLGEGYTPHVRAWAATNPAPPKTVDVGFVGQVTHPRRVELADVLTRHAWAPQVIGYAQTRSFAADAEQGGLDRDGYAAALAATRWAPCPSGPATPDSFRLYEALEVGAVPVVEERNGRGELLAGFWHQMYGDGFPVPVVGSWHALPDLIARTDWNRALWATQEWWLTYKRGVATHAARAAGTPVDTIDAAVTVVIPTSPIPSHPSTAVIEQTVASVRHHLPHADVVITADRPRPELDHRTGDYDEYLRRLFWLANHAWTGVVVTVADDWLHQAGVTARAFDRTYTPLVLFVEHDTPLCVDPIEWDDLARPLLAGTLDSVRLHYESTVNDAHRHMLVDDAPTRIEGAPVWRTWQWSQRPHLARTDRYRVWLDRYFADDARTMIEDTMHGVAAHYWTTENESGWAKFRQAIYVPQMDTERMARSYHLDGRDGDPKFDMRYAYPGGGTPPGAPRATDDRVD